MTSDRDDVRLIRALRLRAQGLVPGVRPWADLADVARGMLAMQGQDASGVRWSLALRAGRRPVDGEVVEALASGTIVRNRPSRGTLQVTAPEDLHWLTHALSPRSRAAAEKRRGDLGLDNAMLDRAQAVIRRELAGGQRRTRPELVAACAGAGLPLDGSQAGHVLRHLTEVMTIVFAEPSGRTDAFALADDWITERREVDRADALAEVARRYVDSRGPITRDDLSRWANLAMADVDAGLAAAGLVEVTVAGRTYLVSPGHDSLSDAEVEEGLAAPLLLAPFDEYLLAYATRGPIVDDEHLSVIVPGRNGMFKPIVVIDGEIVGVWSRKVTASKQPRAVVTVEPFRRLSTAEREALEAPATDYAAFAGATLDLRFG